MYMQVFVENGVSLHVAFIFLSCQKYFRHFGMVKIMIRLCANAVLC